LIDVSGPKLAKLPLRELQQKRLVWLDVEATADIDQLEARRALGDRT
jgi:hypothetical protein